MNNRKKIKNSVKVIKKEYKDAYYNNTSVAYDIQPAYYPEEEVQWIPSSRPRRKSKKQSGAEIRSRIFHRVKLFAAVAVVFAGCIITMGMYASVAAQEVKLSKMKENLQVLQNDNSILQSEISGDMNLEYIEEQAKTRLGMSEPQAYQIVSINVPKQSYTIQYDGTSSKKTEKSYIERITELLKKD